MEIYAAPLEGVTGAAWRRAHAAVVGGCAKYFAPFFSPTRERIMPPRVKRELLGANNPGLALVPQLLCRDPDNFVWAARELFGMGYGEVNLNLGCPSGTVTAKGKGAGFLAFPDELDAFFERVFSSLPGASVSVKTRLGLESEAEFARLLEIFARRPICELTVHVRVRADFYRGPARPDAFALALERFPGPAVYNGDVFTVPDARALASRYPTARALMLGRGLAANPALAREIGGGPRASREELWEFHDLVWDGCVRDFGAPGPAVHRLKERWSSLIHMFAPCAREYRALCKARRGEEYLDAARNILADVPLADGPSFGG